MELAVTLRDVASRFPGSRSRDGVPPKPDVRQPRKTWLLRAVALSHYTKLTER
jgi:hypothetical protein